MSCGSAPKAGRILLSIFKAATKSLIPAFPAQLLASHRPKNPKATNYLAFRKKQLAVNVQSVIYRHYYNLSTSRQNRAINSVASSPTILATMNQDKNRRWSISHALLQTLGHVDIHVQTVFWLWIQKRQYSVHAVKVLRGCNLQCPKNRLH